MQEAGSDQTGRRTLTNELLAGTAVALALLLYGAMRFPPSVPGAGSSGALVSCVALAAYAAASGWARRATDVVQMALGTGAAAGVLLGAVAVTNHCFEMFASLRPPLPAILGVSMWGLMFLLWGGVSAATYCRVGSMGIAVVASVWSALISTAITVVFAVSIGLLFMPHMRDVLSGDFLTSGMADPNAFVVRNLFDAASSHLLIAPVVALVSGTAGGTASWILQAVNRRTAVAFAVLGLLLLAAGTSAIGYASSLKRSARPPFILLGLSSLGVTLASAYPLLLAIRRPTMAQR